VSAIDESAWTGVDAGLALEVSIVPWDTDAFGYVVAQIETIDILPDADPGPALERFHAWLDDRDVRLVNCRLGSLQLRESMLLEELGFRFIEMVYSPVLSPLRPEQVETSRVRIDEAVEGDRAALEHIASTAFTTGRYHLDWRLDAEASRRRYRRWLTAALADERQQVLKASVGNEIVGFFVLEARPADAVYWHLTAVASDWQGQGIGNELWRRMIARHAAEGAQRIETTISAHNVPAINLYAGLGFRFTAPRATYHWLRA